MMIGAADEVFRAIFMIFARGRKQTGSASGRFGVEQRYRWWGDWKINYHELLGGFMHADVEGLIFFPRRPASLSPVSPTGVAQT